jgi:inner membrane transporter RhtA
MPQASGSPSAQLNTASAIRAAAVPPQTFFLISAIFHYLGPSFAVLLFSRVAVLGVVWLRIASAAAVFAIWRRPWQILSQLRPHQRATLMALGGVLAAMNACFYLAIDRVPLGTVGAIEFLGPIGLAAAGARTRRNFFALGLAVAGVSTLTHVRMAGRPIGFLFTFANSALFVLYIVLGHRLAQDGGASGVDRLVASMLVALAVATPFTIGSAIPAFRHPTLLGAGIGVGISSSVIPYVCDQLAMARLPRATFALLLSLLPATATIVGILVLRQVPTAIELAGVSLVIAGVAVHRDPPD